MEADLAKAELGRKEKKLAERYHAVKFFGSYAWSVCLHDPTDKTIERQKVTRKLNRVKRDLESCEEKKEKKKLTKQLLELRVDLNYILVRPFYLQTLSCSTDQLALFSALPQTQEIHIPISTRSSEQSSR